ncbi:glycosyl transferase, family 2 [Pseudoalteromonas sp. SW0106-04]|uniref:glycosyltransferase n=1 Tax=Pseudoalteromonas sp. SW0106-04 TaxID=1702169 RepID=UPI0006C04BFA|nr:glycosyltransferase [Pseudoalteromonas sp. SW0106-04]GAP74582.1 glycosyl transferase, family 2 [Pseudoalteromonas sp. SW0106-04]
MITIAIPCFNTDKNYIKTAIDSVCAQSCSNWVLHVVDGNPRADSALQFLCESYSSDQIRYLRNPDDHSMAGNWNFAFDSANTELVSLLHDDDFLDPTYVAEMLILAKKHHLASAYFCDVDIVDSNSRVSNTFVDVVKTIIRPKYHEVTLSGDVGLSALLKGCFIYCPTIVFRKSKLPSSPFKSKWAMVTDLQFYADVLISGGSIIGSAKKLFSYRRHEGNQTVLLTATRRRFEEELCFYRSLCAETAQLGWHKSLFHCRYQPIIRLHILYQAAKELMHLRIKRVKELLILSFSKAR